MINISIGTSERSLEEADPRWIIEQINRRRRDGVPVCVKVEIHDPFINIVLSTPDCQGIASSGRLPNAKEKAIFDLWRKLGLNNNDFSENNVVEFLMRISK